MFGSEAALSYPHVLSPHPEIPSPGFSTNHLKFEPPSDEKQGPSRPAIQVLSQDFLCNWDYTHPSVLKLPL
jgi:hypothetical protein